MGGKSGFVLQTMPGIFVSKTKFILAVILFVILVVIIIILAAVLGKHMADQGKDLTKLIVFLVLTSANCR